MCSNWQNFLRYILFQWLHIFLYLFNLQVFKSIEPPKMEPLPLALPSEPSGPLHLARAYERPRPTHDCHPQLVEEYILETERTSPHGPGFFHIKLSILQRPSDQEFLGELYVDRDHVEGERNGAACRFALGKFLNLFCTLDIIYNTL